MNPTRRRVVSVVAALVAAGAMVVAERADGAVLCRKRSGRVVIAESCGRRQTPLTVEELGLVGPPGTPGAAGTPGAPGVLPYRVVDALGRPVGIVQSRIGFRTQVVLAHAALPAPIQLEVVDGMVAEGLFSDAVWYAAAGCTGQPFIQEGPALLPRGHLVGDTVYYTTGERAEASFESVETEDVACSGGMETPRGACCRATATMTLAAPAAAVPLAALDIMEPLALEPRP